MKLNKTVIYSSALVRVMFLPTAAVKTAVGITPNKFVNLNTMILLYNIIQVFIQLLGSNLRI